MAQRRLTNGSLLKYERSQNRILHLTRRLVNGENQQEHTVSRKQDSQAILKLHDEILEEYSRLCISIKPSNTERALALLVKHRRDTLRRLV